MRRQPMKDLSMRWWNWKVSKDQLWWWVEQLIGNRPYTPKWDPKQPSHMDFEKRVIIINPTQVTDFLSSPTSILPYRWRGIECHELADLQWMVSRAITRHECAHVLYTEPHPHKVVNQVHQTLVNILEDGRIERAMGLEFEYTWGDFLHLGSLLWSSKPTLHPNEPGWYMDACLNYRWDVTRRPGLPSKMLFATDEQRDTWHGFLKPLVDEAHWADSTERVYDIALEILRKFDQDRTMPDYGDKDKSRNIDQKMGPQPKGQRQQGDPASKPGQSQGQRRAPSQPQRREQLERQTQDEHRGSPSVGDAGQPPIPEERLTHPDQAWQARVPYEEPERKIMGQATRLAQALAAPAPDSETRVSEDYGDFSVREDIMSQGEAPFLQLREWGTSPKGLAVVGLVDTTGSNGGYCPIDRETGLPHYDYSFNSGRMPYVRRGLHLLERTCAMAGIPLSLAAVAGSMTDHRSGSAKFPMNATAWLRTWDTPPHDELSRAIIEGLMGAGGDESYMSGIHQATLMLDKRSEETKVILYFMDGASTNEEHDEVRDYVEKTRRRGYHITAIYVGPVDSTRYGQWDRRTQAECVEFMFGKEDSIIVGENLDLLPDKIEAVLRKYRNY